MGLAARRPLAVGLVVALLAVAGGVLAAVRLEPSTATDTLVSRSSEAYKASARFHQNFGDDAVYVLVQQKLTSTVLTSDLGRVVGLEGCIAGNVPKDQKPLGPRGGPCWQLAKAKPARVVFGPGTFLNTSVGRLSDEYTARFQQLQAAASEAGQRAQRQARKQGLSRAETQKRVEQAQQAATAPYIRDALQLAQRYGLNPMSPPTLGDTALIQQIVFDASKPACTPKARFAYIFPRCESALIQVRLKPDLSQKERENAIALIRAAAKMPQWKLENGKGRYVVTGAPVVVGDLAVSVTDATSTLLIAALLVMALALALAFRRSLRLLPLVVALAAVGITFGLLAVFGASLTMASIAVLPVLIGLGVDYAIQLQSRMQEEPAPSVAMAAARVAQRAAPTVATAAAATAAGFLVLVISPVPMVRGFGLIMVGGIALAFACALTLGVAALVAAERRSGRGSAGGPGRRLADAGRDAGELVFDNRASRAVRRVSTRGWNGALGAARMRPQRILAIALAAAALGWVLDTQTSVESDITKLVPQNLPALSDLEALEKSTGVGGEIDVVLRGADLTEPEVISWMSNYQARLTKRYGFSESRGCGKAELCPAFSLPDLFAGGATTKSQITALLDQVPEYFSQNVITKDRKTATLAFGIRLMPLERQEQVVNTMRDELDPPPGVSAELAGLPVLAADANAAVASPWRRALLGIAGLLAVALVLLVAFRDVRRALIPLIPIALATGWSALVLFLTRIPLNPMSVTLGALVIAISTEFSVLLSERFRQERAAGHSVDGALQRAYSSTGAAVLASGTTAIAGFAVLVLADIRMLRDFGAVTVIDLLVSLLGVLVVLPAVLVLAEEGRLALPQRPRVRRPRLRGAAEDPA
jgi:hydrophobe/amphiphile efflux-3 (HAE3) family protein